MTPPLGYRDSEKYAAFPVGREVLVVLQAAKADPRSPGFLDFSAAKWEFHLRFLPLPLVAGATPDRDYVMDKITGKAAPGDTGIAQVGVSLPTARAALHVEWVAVETDQPPPAGVTTLSTHKEHALDLPWIAAAVASPTP